MVSGSRLYASLLSTDGKESIEIDNLIGQDRLRELIAAGRLVCGKVYKVEDIACLLSRMLAKKGRYQFVYFDNISDWSRRCL